ncbi:hypothetical protein BECP10_00011 [Escherichia phage vB_EcoS-BECP10]|uniref:Uncharacterized protein n=1 Tax=Escherichia phage vB_EcoS-BECP10 TaxID=2797407 RepID=A0A7T7GTY1_9CAUD|nr:hypothetical protein BECP10_00011 [Escherichia phage vB_EcoS-BECP10]
MNENVRIYITRDAIYCKSLQYGTKYRYCKDRGRFCVIDYINLDGLLETFLDTFPSDKLWNGVPF